MLTKVEVRTRQGTLLNLPLEDVDNGFIIEEIEGLDPVKATLVSSSVAQVDGAQYHSSRREPRNLKFKIGLEPDYINSSVKSLRTRLYSFFMPKSEVDLRFIDSDGLEVDISGRVESCDSPLFSKDPEVDVSIMCFAPDFYDRTPVVINELTTSTTDEILIPYEGTVETGVRFTLHVDRSLTQFNFYHRPPDGTLRSLNFARAMVVDDVLVISTVPGSKGAALTRANVVSSALDSISPQSNWIELQPGDNYIRVYAEGAGVPFDLEYTTKYGGL